MNLDILQTRCDAALNKLAKWRTIFVGWQLGTRAKGDPEADAVRDHRELTMLMRNELNAITGLLARKGVFTQEEFLQQLMEEAQHLEKAYEERFPGVKATSTGLTIDTEVTQREETFKGWLP